MKTVMNFRGELNLDIEAQGIFIRDDDYNQHSVEKFQVFLVSGQTKIDITNIIPCKTLADVQEDFIDYCMKIDYEES